MNRYRIFAVAVALALSLACGNCAELRGEPSVEGIESPLKIENLPLIRAGVQTHQFCSYDRAGDNYDRAYFPLYTQPNGEAVLFDAMGPGCLYRHQMNLWRDSTEGISIRYYFDDEQTPRIDMDVSVFFSDKNPLGIFRSPYAYDGGANFRIMYCPMFFKKRLKITLSREPGGQGTARLPWMGPYKRFPHPQHHWYHFTYHTYTTDFGAESWTPDHGQMAPYPFSDPDKLGQDPKPVDGNKNESTSAPLPAGKRISLANVTGAGSIAAVHISIEPLSEEALFQTWIRMTWDGKRSAQVYAPLGAFFGAYRRNLDSSFSSLPLGYSPSSMYCYFPMPFWKSAAIELENRGKHDIKAVNATVQYKSAAVCPYPNKACGYFFASYNEEFPRQEGIDYTYLEWAGQGHVVGHTVSRFGTSMEEDERTYFDGSLTPQIYGDGFEDDHNMGWGLKNIQQPVFGAIGASGGEGGVYRFYIPDLYFFQSQVKNGHQVYGPHSPRGHEGMYSVGREESVAFFYARELPGLVLTDELDIGKQDSEAKHAYRVFGTRKDKTGAYWYDGEFNNVLRTTPAIVDDGVSFTGRSEFRVKIDPANHGVRIRRRTDKEDNRQAARVYVDGKLVSERPWYTVDFEKTFRDIRWLDTDFEIPSKYTKNKSSIDLKIVYASAENGEWDEYHYWIYSYK